MNSLFQRFLGAGFYYKTFIGPFEKSWMWYEHIIRKAAGMGAATTEPDPDKYEKVFKFCDVLVVGSQGLQDWPRPWLPVVLEHGFCWPSKSRSWAGRCFLHPKGSPSDQWLKAQRLKS